MGNFSGVQGLRRIEVFCGVKKNLNESITKNILSWFGHVERKVRNRIVNGILRDQSVKN